MPIHVRAEPGEYAEAVLLPGDPLRAKYIAETYLEGVEQRNAERGLLGYTGTWNGKPVSVQGTGMAADLAEYLHRRGQTARTITTKLRYPDFSIRTRSTSLPVGIADGDRIGELACALLDRALRDRPGPLRLVGVGVSGLVDHAQLSLVEGVQ